MATFAETSLVISRACRWAEEHPRRRKLIQSDLEVMTLMADLRVSQASAASPIGRFMARAALRVGHNEDIAPLELLAKYRVGTPGADPLMAGLKDLRGVTAGHDGTRVLHRLVHMAGQGGCHLYQLGKILHCLADEGGADERPADAQEFLFGLTGVAYRRRWRLEEQASK